MNSNVNMDGAVDFHTHCGPSLDERRVDGYESAIEAAQNGFDGLVLKEHYLPTVYGIPYIDRLLDADGVDIEVMGSLVMNRCNGGYNPEMVSTCLGFGAKVIWAPTKDAYHDCEMSGSIDTQAEQPSEGDGESLYALDEEGEIKPEVRACLDHIISEDAVLGLGHASFEETVAMVVYMSDHTTGTAVVDHPDYYIPGFDLEQQQELVECGAYIDYMYLSISPMFGHLSPLSYAEIYDNIRTLGVDNCLLASDCGQVANSSGPDGIRILAELLYSEGLTQSDIDVLIKDNPKQILGIE